MPDSTYQTIIYSERGGATQVIGSGGTIDLASGATLSVISGANIGLAGGDLAGDDARRLLISNPVPVVIGPDTNDSVLSVLNLPKNVRFLQISTGSNMVSASFWLTSCSAGAEVWIQFGGGSASAASCQIDISCSGCSLLGSVGTNLSGLELHASAASNCILHLVAFEDNVWSVVYERGDIND